MTPEEYPAFIRSHRAVLAPMAGVTDVVFRRICERHGAGLAFCEMVSAKGLAYGSKKTRELMRRAPGEQAFGVQLFGHDPDEMAREAAFVEDELGEALVEVDINMGCPVRKVAGKGDGAALMRDPALAARMVAATVEAVDVPVTAKVRRGFFEGEETAPELARRLEQAGASAVTVHGRYAKQLYRGKADWGVIARVKQAVSIPVVGNGDVVDGASAVAMVRRTGCDAVMVARGAEGNPWVFEQVDAALAGRPQPAPPTAAQRVEQAREHMRMVDADPLLPLARMRKQASWYLRGLPGAAAARGRLNACESAQDYERVFDDLLARLAEDEGEGAVEGAVDAARDAGAHGTFEGGRPSGEEAGV